MTEAYIFFFMSLPARYKQDFHRKFPSGSPPPDVDMSDVYEHARTLSVALQWTDEKKETVNQTKGHYSVGKETRKNDERTNRSTDAKNKTTQEKKGKDDSLESWGPKQTGEAWMFIKADRCMDCGKKGWKVEGHPCRRNHGKSGGSPKNEYGRSIGRQILVVLRKCH